MKKEIYALLKRAFVTVLLLTGVHYGLGAQNITVSGQVMGPDGLGLPGVSIIIQGTASGTVSNVDGTYSLGNVPSDAILVFNFVGFQTQEVAVNGRTLINVALEEELMGLNEVVVIGYGTQRREAVTGSVSTVTGDRLREVPSANITQALQGRVAGVELSQVSSKPGAEMQVRIRGTRSLNATNDPLIVLDGIPFAGKLSDISPSDIKSIDILKDASASAIYGSRGANGVIIITTHKGMKGQAARISYNGYVGVRTLFNRYPMMNGPEFVQLRKDIAEHGTSGTRFENSLEESNDINTDWQDLMYENGLVTNHDISVTGGTETANYNVGIGYYNDESLLPGQDFERYSLRASVEQKIGNYVSVGLTTNSNYSVRNGDNVPMYSVLSASPLISPYDDEGNLKRIIRMSTDNQWNATRETMESLGDQWANRTRGFGTYNSVYGEVEAPWVKGLKYRINVGLNYRQEHFGQYTGQAVFSADETTLSSATVSNSHTFNWAIDNLLTFDRQFGKHNLNLTGLYSAEKNTYFRSRFDGRGITSDHLQYYNLGFAEVELSANPGNQNYEESGLMSWMGRVIYSYDNKYMAQISVRSDGSSRLAEGHKWHSYPSISLGWNINRESFLSDVMWMNQLKLRAGYGQTSNQAIPPYYTMGTLASRPYNFGNTNATGFYVSDLPNLNLGWEFTESYNVALDFTVLNSRLSGSFEYYHQYTSDLLFLVKLPETSGASSVMANIGKSENRGWELNLNGTIIDNRGGWTWDAGFNFYTNKNQITELASGLDRDEANSWFVGSPINVIYDYKKIGLWQEGDPYLDILEPGGNVGMIKVEYTGEYNEDGTPVRAIGADDRQILEVDPKFQGGFNTRVAYNNWDLSVVGAFRHGGILISTLHSANGYLNMLSGRRNNVKVDYWTPDNTDAKYPRPGGVTSGDNPKYGSTMGYFDGGYLKIRTITLGYNFNKKALDNIGISNLRVYATVQNPFVLFSPFNDETGMDPETNSYGDENSAVVGYPSRLLTIGTNTPATRNYLVGVSLSF